jgi:hypothetical protein
MPTWARTFVLIIGTMAWLAIVAVSLWLQQIPSAMIVGFLPALWLALSGRNSITQDGASQDETVTPPEQPAARQEGPA